MGRGRPPTSGGEDREVGRTPRGRGHRGEPVPAEPRRSQAVLRRAPELVAAPTRGATRRVVPIRGGWRARNRGHHDSAPACRPLALPHHKGLGDFREGGRAFYRLRGAARRARGGMDGPGLPASAPRRGTRRDFHGRSRHCPSASMASRKRSRSCRRRQPRRHRVHLRHCSITRTGAATQSPRQVSAACPCMP